MRPDDHVSKDHTGRPQHPHERRPDPRGATQAPRSWTSKTMHHPATRIGEIKHGKQ
jgi:hypothetical protein